MSEKTASRQIFGGGFFGNRRSFLPHLHFSENYIILNASEENPLKNTGIRTHLFRERAASNEKEVYT